ncbi:protein toll-like [Planococcus citri]|uniref:protein toll-like n=1 Tax=Planococcus citri TaxID=170843 RepID=UPI0031F8DFAD
MFEVRYVIFNDKKSRSSTKPVRKMSPWWLCFCLASFTSFNPVTSSPNKCEKLNYIQNFSTYYCKSRSTSNHDHIKVTTSLNDQLEIKCSTYNESDYINLIEEIKLKSTFNQLVIEHCRVPNLSFFEYLRILNIRSVKNVSFHSSTESPTYFNSNHFEKLTFVETLNLQDNHIVELAEQIFNDLDNLEELNLSGNELKSLPVKLFEPLKKLRRLNLQRNNFMNLNENILRYIPALTYLNLCDNHLNYVSTSLFNSAYNLTVLKLCNNNITILENGVFENLQFLNETDLSDNKLTSLPGNLFDKCGNLKILKLNGNSLKMLPDYIFQNTRNLTQLDIGNNRLENLTEHVFDDLTKLRILRLNENNLTNIHRDVFHHLTSLCKLNLSKNQLKRLDRTTFLDLINLKSIDLSYNQLTLEDAKIGELSPFIACLNLKNIKLNNNLLTRVFADWRLLFNKLEELDLSFNHFEGLTTEDFMFNASNATINFSDNPIKIVNLDSLEIQVLPPCSRSDFFLKNFSQKPTHHNNFIMENSRIQCDCHALSLAKYFQMKLHQGVYKLMNLSANGVYCDSNDNLTENVPLDKVNLTELRCPIRELYPDQADKCPKNCDCHYRLVDRANIVNCSRAELDVLPTEVPIVNNSKTELLFSRNQIKTLDGLSNLTRNIENITVISLSRNLIENIDDLEIPKTLEVLRLDNNQISHIKQHTINLFRPYGSLTNLSIHDNPWECNCDLRPFQNFLRFHRQTLWIDKYSNIKCKKTDTEVRHTWEEKLCQSPFEKYSLLVAILAIICISAIIITYYKFRRRIKIWMFANKICLWLVTEKEIDKNKPYDAFVSFSHKDQHFVDEHLIPELEQNGKHRFKLCIHYRDFKVGQFIPSQIIHSVENSKRTIIVLTPNFLQSIWARMEFRMAHLQAIKEGCARVIVILLEDVDHELLDPELKAYVMLNTYVKWGDSLFWDKLRYALPHPQIKSKKNRKLRRNMFQAVELGEIAEGQKS